MTGPAETYIFNIIKPLISECEFSIASTKEFNSKFHNIQSKFDPNLHEVVSWDIKSMYSNINIDKVTSYIIDKIYIKPENYFTETETDPNTGKNIKKNNPQKHFPKISEKNFNRIFRIYHPRWIL